MDSTKRHELATMLFNDSQFLALTNNRDRVEYVLKQVWSYEKFRAEALANLELARHKSAKRLSKAIGYKALADECKKQVSSADTSRTILEYYAKAILYTPPSEINFLCQLYQCKAQVHAEKMEHEAAEYSTMIANELRDKKYDNKLEDEEAKPEEEPYISYRIDPRCNIRNLPNVGRHFVANEDIPVDTIVYEEKPYSSVMESQAMDRCNMCYHKLHYKFFPCRFCTEMVFCDGICFRRAYRAFHRFECGGIMQLLKQATTPVLHVYRMISRVGGPLVAYQTQKSLARYSMEDYLAEENQRLLPEWRKTQEEKCRAYKMACTLWAHDDKHGDLKNLHHTILAIETAVLVDLAHGLRKQRPDLEFFIKIVEMIVVDIRRIIFNVFGWHDYDSNGVMQDYVANCQCLLGSLINHSCVPNITWSFKDGTIRFTTNRPVRKGDELTITYGPNRDIPYFKRQERLNHYLFACKCKICFDDARQGDSLRCRDCSGPVVFNSALNLEPTLNGKCIKCYAKYEDFPKAIEQLSDIKESIKLTSSLALLLPNRVDILERAIEHATKMVDLSLVNGESNQRYLELCSITVGQLRVPFDEKYSLKDKVQLAVLFHRNLPMELPAAMISSKMIANLQFWLTTLIECISKSAQRPIDQQTDQSTMWNAMLAFHYRLQRAIKSLDCVEMAEHQDGLPLLKQMIDNKSEVYRQAVDKCIQQFAPQNAQFKMFGDHMWARFSS